MKVKNKWGSSNYEFLVVAIVCLILTIVLLFLALKNDDTEKFQVFCYNAKKVSLNAIVMEENDTIYLQEMTSDGLISPIKNPFGGAKLCDMEESKVEILNGQRLVTLRCGNYLIYRQKLGEDTYPIYQVSSWTKQKSSSTNDERIVYNLKVNNKTIFDTDYEEALFLRKVNRYFNASYSKLDEIDEQYKIVTTKMYRKKVKIAEVVR